ncbi:MAG: twin-arginine translocase subunit TatC [Cytophagaceae bacterium]|jgi:sec-independent protein translocase protein TatC|nr:twin-arginine translocase subunit TatC [Cytophagaceae bacterium]
MSEQNEMSFLDHLEDLRSTLLKCVIAIFIGALGAFIFMDKIFKYVLIAPAKPDFWTYKYLCKISESTCVDHIDFALQNRTLTGQFSMHILAAIITGFVVSAPFVFYQIWKFISPALHPGEKKYAAKAVFFVSFLFFLGVLFGYFLLSPLSINFLANYQIFTDDTIQVHNDFDITDYISMLCMMVLSGGIAFQLPVAIYVLSSLGILGPALLRKYRRHAILIIMIAAAILTPSPDIFSQLVVGLPMLLLYEISIWLSVSIEKRKIKKAQAYV